MWSVASQSSSDHDVIGITRSDMVYGGVTGVIHNFIYSSLTTHSDNCSDIGEK